MAVKCKWVKSDPQNGLDPTLEKLDQSSLDNGLGRQRSNRPEYYNDRPDKTSQMLSRLQTNAYRQTQIRSGIYSTTEIRPYDQ